MSSFMEPLASVHLPTLFFQMLAILPSPQLKGSVPVTAMNSKIDNTIHERNLLEKAGLATVDVSAWLAARHELRNDFGADSRACSDYWDLGQKLRAQLPKRAARNPNDTAAS